MTQKNFMSARALNMEELENVNGGRLFGLIPDDDQKILPAGGAFNPSSFLSQSPDFLKPGLCYVQDFLV